MQADMPGDYSPPAGENLAAFRANPSLKIGTKTEHMFRFSSQPVL
jgi:hypothetical protein